MPRHWALVLATALSLMMVAPVQAATPTPMAAGTASSSWIVTLKAGADVASVAPGLARQAGGGAERIFEHALHGFEFRGSAQAAEALKRDPQVRTVVANRPVHMVAETITPGIKRIRADHPTQPDAHDSGYLGAGSRIAIIDTGIDLTHPDLVGNIDQGLNKNCVGTGPPQDGHGHGTHVAGIAAATRGNNIGVVGVAPSARLVAVKVLDDQGNGDWAGVICGIDYVTGLATDSDPSNNVDVVNMSLGDVGSIGNCSDGGLREAICSSVGAGITYVVAAGNSAVDTSTFIPAAFPEVIAVSAFTDFDGEPGGLAGCQFIFDLFGTYCDDAIAAFSNDGARVDVTAPGVRIYSTWTGGGYNTIDGTSMASPHVAGVAALVKAVNHSLTPAQVKSIVKLSGEYPDGTSAATNCGSTSTWAGDPDGIAEPLVNALRAAQYAAQGGVTGLPQVSITSPADGATVTGTTTFTASASDSDGIASVQFIVDGTVVGTGTSAPFSVQWDTTSTFDAVHSITARATDTTGAYACAHSTANVGPNRQGNWVGNYGADGYAIGSWWAQGDDLVTLPSGGSLTLVQGARATWAATTSDVRALQSPDQSERRATRWWDVNQIRLHIAFASAYTGTLHAYAVDWDSTVRREDVTVAVGASSKTVHIGAQFDTGGWTHFPISVAAGGSVTITVTKVAGPNIVLSGLFLGGAGTPPPAPPPPPPAYDQGVQGNWVGNYGADGYALGAWNGTSGDLTGLPNGSVTLLQGGRASWSSSTTDIRALQSPDQTSRRATTWFDQTQLRLRLDFTSAYTGTLHVYAIDWDSSARRQNVTVSDGSTSRSINITAAFNGGAWMHFSISVPAGGAVNITVDRTAGNNAVISGLFLGGAGTPPPPPPPEYEPGVQGNWVGNYGADGHVIGAWNGTTDLASLTNGSFSLVRGSRATWVSPTTDVRALQSPDTSTRRATAWFDTSQLQLRLSFTAAYSGTLHVYAVDWDSSSRRENVTVNDGTTTKVVNITTAFNTGAWMHFPISVGAGGTVNITVDRVAGNNVVISGLFLGGSVSPPPPTAPGQPSLTATAGNGQVALSWTTPANGGSTITGYQVYRGTSSGTETLLTTLGVASGYTDSSAVNGTTYWYQVSAVNAVGESSRSTEKSATPAAPATAPGQPSLTATAGNAQVALSWTTPANGGSTITGYQVYRGTSSGTETLLTTLGVVTSYVDTSVTNGTTYWYQVSAVNAVGEGSRSTEKSATPAAAATAPGQPSLTATAGNAQVALSWTTPADGGSAITGYKVYRGTSSGTETLLTTLGVASGYTDTSAVNGTTYWYQVSAVNAVDEGSRSTEKSATPTAPATAPSAPRNLTATQNRAKGIDLAWLAPTSTGGSAITGYQIWRARVSGSETLLTTVGAVTSYRDTATTKGTRYYYVVRASNAIGQSPASNESTAVAK